MRAAGLFLIACSGVSAVIGVGYMLGMSPIIDTPWSVHRSWTWWEVLIPVSGYFLAGLLAASESRPS